MKWATALKNTAAAMVAAVCLTTHAFAAEVTLRIDGITGDSRSVPGGIDILSYSHEISNSGTSHVGGGGGAGKATFSDLAVVKELDKSTPKLIEACASGKHIPMAVLTSKKSGKKGEAYLEIKMQDVLITSYQTGGSGPDNSVPTDSLSLNFAKVSYAYHFGGEVVEIKWNIAGNTSE